MKKLSSIFLFFGLTISVNSQSLVNLTATKSYDKNNSIQSSVTTTLYVSVTNIASINNSGSGSLIFLKDPAYTNDGLVYSYSVTSTPAAIAALASSTSINVPTNTTYSGTAITALASEVVNGLLTVGSTTAMTITLPTTALLQTQTGAGAGSVFDFSVVNTIGSGNTVTIAVGTGMTASGFPSANTLTLANSATVGIARFRIQFISATASTLTRIN